MALPMGLLQTRTTQGSAARQPGTAIPGFWHPPAEPHIRLNVRYGSEAEVQQTRAGCLLLAISGHSGIGLHTELGRTCFGVFANKTAQCADAMLDRGDMGGYAVWKSAILRIATALGKHFACQAASARTGDCHLCYCRR